ncbi:MAG: S8 family serine peptidase, partial [Candidatus Aminicenantes bacterium]
MSKLKKFPFRVFGVMLTLVLLVFGSALFHAEHNPADDHMAQVAGKKKYDTDRIMVQADSFKEAKRIANEHDLKVLKDFKALSNKRGHWYGVFARKNNNTTPVEEIVSNLQNTPGIRYAGFDYQVSIFQTPNDPKFSELWGMHNTGQTGGTADADIDAPEAWDLATGSSGVIIAVIDTGVDYNHTDLSPNMWRNPGEVAGNGVDDDGNGYIDDIYGIDAYNSDSDPYDDHFHGTHCAGTVGAKGNDGFGVVGVNWDVKIMALKFLGSGGSGPTSGAVTCMDYVIDQKQKGQNIIATSNSWGGGGADQNLLDAINTAGNLGVLFVAAAGNNSADNDTYNYYPSNYNTEYIISVAATDHNDQLASFSSWGANSVELGAPGVSVVSDSPGNGFRTLNGTSMATPHVAGAVGLLASVFPNDTPLERKARICDYVDPIPALSGKTITGGRLNVYQAVQSAPFVVAKFSWTKNGDLTRVFTDESTANYCTITGWSWNFGDGNTSTQQNPTHTYASAGFYDVTLTVTADTGASDSETQTLWAGPNQAPTADFTYSTPGGFQATFTDQSTDPDGTIAGWNWDFGDGGTSTQQNPTHQYQYPGTYSVTLIATDDEGASDSVTKDVVVPLSYCASSASSANPVAITNVEIGPLSNSSGKSTYSDFMNMTANMNRGQTYTVTITTDSSFWDCYTRIYIDYNLDGDFNDANEIAFEVFITTGSYTGEMTIPSSGVVTGKKVGMRVSAKTNSYRAPCGDRDG